ncbi:MAG: cytochrome C oxidase subunit IV family protein [Opitutus sp.]|nr:cytochrome C oxidase subunit IV family protein [Opitutus sp.]MCS6275071.1 cytochrome C oxidase subunit IV family protein [Opitutus sp.]MCS6278267.1 cytochrome C oxidase subunit IV family protein [Opitutus sp.]MCS6299377.1 cytochrome C oxidase subunit IV family protein [Opitutus sp.]
MSAPIQSSVSADHGHTESSKFHIFVQLAMILAVITGVEIVLIYLPLVKWLIVSSLVILSVVKFMLVIFVFMHLKWDKLFCTILFFIGLILAAGTVAALMAIFSATDSVPLKALEIYAEKAQAAK